MRFDLEQFLALTVALGTAGAVGVAVYTNMEARAEAAESAPVTAPDDIEVDDTDDWPSADLTPPVVAPTPPAPPSPMPALDAAPEALEAAPGPQVEGAW